MSVSSLSGESYKFRPPNVGDASGIRQLVQDSGVLDANSTYAYLLVCRDFAETSAVACLEGELAGFVSAYAPPQQPETLFVWQIAVSSQHQRQGLALRMLKHVLLRPALRGVRQVEATIAPSNAPSRKLFRSLSSALGTEFQERPGFQPEDFGGEAHEAEPRIVVGPISSDSLVRLERSFSTQSPIT